MPDTANEMSFLRQLEEIDRALNAGEIDENEAKERAEIAWHTYMAIEAFVNA